MAVYAFLCIYQALPKFRVRDCLLAVAGIGLAVSIRIGGLLLPLYFAAGLLMVFCFNKTLRQTLLGNIPLMARTAGICAGIAIAGALLGLCFYPNFFYEGPFDHIKNAFGMVSAHPEHIKFMWEGTLEDSQNLPPFYLAKAYLYTIPLFVLGGAALFLLNIRRIAWECSVFQICFLVFTVAFPIAYIVLGKAHLYNGWRHTLFVYPTFAPLAAIGLYEMGNVFSKKNLWGKLGRWAYRAAAVAAILPVAKWTAQNYKYAYSSYYNELAGNIRGRFDQDIYSTAEVLSFRWLLQNRLTDATRQYTICVKGGPV